MYVFKLLDPTLLKAWDPNYNLNMCLSRTQVGQWKETWGHGWWNGVTLSGTSDIGTEQPVPWMPFV